MAGKCQLLTRNSQKQSRKEVTTTLGPLCHCTFSTHSDSDLELAAKALRVHPKLPQGESLESPPHKLQAPVCKCLAGNCWYRPAGDTNQLSTNTELQD